MNTFAFDLGEVLNRVDFGSAPEWVAAILTSVALLIAAFSYRSENVRRRTQQARLVYGSLIYSSQTEAGSLVETGPGGVRLVTYALNGLKPAKDEIGNDALKSDVDMLGVRIRVHNESDELVGPVLAILSGAGVELALPALAAFIVHPHASTDAHIVCEWTNAPHDARVGYEIAFRDSSGNWWTRYENYPIKPADSDRSAVFERVAAERIADAS